jgi:hypothetical protein
MLKIFHYGIVSKVYVCVSEKVVTRGVRVWMEGRMVQSKRHHEDILLWQYVLANGIL